MSRAGVFVRLIRICFDSDRPLQFQERKSASVDRTNQLWVGRQPFGEVFPRLMAAMKRSTDVFMGLKSPAFACRAKC